MKKYLLGFLLACASFSTFSQVNNDLGSTSDAVNSGVNLSGGATNQHSYSIGLPSVNPGGVGVDKCLTSGIEQKSGLWNGIYDTTVVQKWSDDCGFPKLVEVFVQACQFYSARVIMDAHVSKKFNLKMVEVYGGDAAYKAELAKNQNLSLAECIKLRTPAQPPLVFEAPSAGPKAATAASAPASAPAPVVAASQPPLVVQLPPVREQIREKVVSLTTITLFPTGKHDLSPEGRKAIEKAMSQFNVRNIVSITVEGRTDRRGSVDYNQALSERRAEAVASAIRIMGYLNVSAVGFGKTAPIVDGDTPEAWGANRSVTITVRETVTTSTAMN